MARRKTVIQLENQLKYATARKAYVAPAREPGTASVTARNKTPLRYQVMSIGGTTPTFYTIRASIHSLEFFGSLTGAEVGLAIPQGDPRASRGFKPAKIHATKTNDKGVVTTSKPSGRPYLKYTNPAASGQSSYSCPICSPTGMPGVATLVRTIYTEKSTVLGPYGRLYVTPEYYSIID